MLDCDPAKSALWKFFESEASNATLATYLRRPQSNIIAALCREHLETEVEALKQRLARGANTRGPAEHNSCQGDRIVLSNHALNERAGSELWVHDVADYGVKKGLDLVFYSPVLGSVADSISALGITVTCSAAEIRDFAPTLIHVNHYASVRTMVGLQKTDLKIVNMIHGVLPLPSLPQPVGVNSYAVVSLATKAKVHLLTNTDWDQIVILPNFYDERSFANPIPEGRQKRALIYSSKAKRAQIIFMHEALSSLGYQLDWMGCPSERVMSPGKLLPHYEVVFAVGRSAIEALACGCRVVLWDDGIIGPSVNLQNFWSCLILNFALTSKQLPFRPCQHDQAKTWLGAQLEPPTVDESWELTRSLRRHLSLENVGPLLLEVYARALGG